MTPHFPTPWLCHALGGRFFTLKVVTISLQPDEVNSGKNSGRILFAMKQRNFIGRQVGKRRNELDWTQDYLADQLEDAGWRNATRSTVSKIEDGSLRIDLTQLFYLAVALRVHPIHFLPKMDWSKPVKAQIYSR
jgi:DNA-binding XRE family transcriptional regulator